MPAFLATTGMPLWAELRTHNIQKSRDFYSALFGWDIEVTSQGYFTARLQGMPIVGMIQISQPEEELGEEQDADSDSAGTETSDEWMLSFLADDLDHMALDVRENGGWVSQEFDGPRGPMRVVRDVVNAPLGLIHPLNEPFIAAGQPGTPVWHELTAYTDEASSRTDVIEFYREVLKWETMTHGEGDGSVVTAMVDGQAFAGIWFPPAGPESSGSRGQWVTYFGVENIEKAADLVQQHGGEVIAPPQESEFGRVCVVADCGGATLTLCEAPEPVEEPHEGDNIF